MEEESKSPTVQAVTRKPAKGSKPKAKPTPHKRPTPPPRLSAPLDDFDYEEELDEETVEQKRMQDSLDFLRTAPKVKIVIASTETAKDDVKLGFNGHVYQIPRDIEVEVPEPVANSLLDCKITTYRQQKRADGEEGMEMIPVEVSRFPVSIRR